MRTIPPHTAARPGDPAAPDPVARFCAWHLANPGGDARESAWCWSRHGLWPPGWRRRLAPHHHRLLVEASSARAHEGRTRPPSSPGPCWGPEVCALTAHNVDPPRRARRDPHPPPWPHQHQLFGRDPCFAPDPSRDGFLGAGSFQRARPRRELGPPEDPDPGDGARGGTDLRGRPYDLGAKAPCMRPAFGKGFEAVPPPLSRSRRRRPGPRLRCAAPRDGCLADFTRWETHPPR